MLSKILNKGKFLIGFGVVLQVVRVFFPQLDISNEFEESARNLIETLYVFVPIVLSWFVKESPATVAALAVK